MVVVQQEQSHTLMLKVSADPYSNKLWVSEEYQRELHKSHWQKYTLLYILSNQFPNFPGVYLCCVRVFVCSSRISQGKLCQHTTETLSGNILTLYRRISSESLDAIMYMNKADGGIRNTLNRTKSQENHLRAKISEISLK